MVRFDKPCLQVGAAVNYFREHMAKRDYLSRSEDEVLTWVGEGAKQLGLEGHVRESDFARICEGKHPVTGERLSVRQKGPVKRVCYFGQISPPKDVSIAYLVGRDERIAGWWKEAVAETLREIEAVTASRIRKGGVEDQDRVTNKMVAAIVTHDCSRALDPQLHTHICIMNTTYDDVEQQWKSVQPDGYYQHQGYFREVCYNKLAERMTDAGYQLEVARSIGFHIKGFPEELRNHFSKRHEEIEKMAQSLGVKSQDGKQKIAGSTRAEKVVVDSEELRRRWMEASGEQLEQVKGVIEQANGRRHIVERVTVERAVDLAKAHVFERHSAINERVLLREALIFGRGDVSLLNLKAEIEKRVVSGELIRKGEQIVSRETLRMETEYLNWVLTYKRHHSQLGRVSNLDPELTQEQREAVAKILMNRDQVIILEGKAGTGKTRTLREIVKGIEKQGGEIFVCAPSSGATEVLRKELSSNADTLQQLLVNQSLQNRIRNKVVIVDEAGLISSEQMRDLCRVAKENKNRLVLVGDIGQHNSVQAGDALRALQTYGNVTTARLTQIKRQKDPWFRKAVSLLADRKAYEAFSEFYRSGAVKEISDPKELITLAVENYVKTVREKKSCLVISPVWADIHRFTDELRPQLKAMGALDAHDQNVPTYLSYQWTEATRQDYRKYKKGDVLTFHKDSGGFTKGEYVYFEDQEGTRIIVKDEQGRRFRFDPAEIGGFDVGLSRVVPICVGEKLLIKGNLKEHNLSNGNIVEVSGIHEDGTIMLKDKRTIPPQFRQFSYGYGTTSHAAQGKTVQHGIVIMGDEGIRAANLKQAYVSHSRFEESHITFTTNYRAALEAMATPADRALAIEVANDRIRHWKLCQDLTEQSELWEQQRQRVVQPHIKQVQ